MTVDPQVHELATQFVEDTIETANVEVTEEQRRAFHQRGAEAMQTAIEEECSAIEAELDDAAGR
jgi:hypothetical protein